MKMIYTDLVKKSIASLEKANLQGNLAHNFLINLQKSRKDCAKFVLELKISNIIPILAGREKIDKVLPFKTLPNKSKKEKIEKVGEYLKEHESRNFGGE